MTPRNLATDSLKFILAVMVVGLHAGVFFETAPLVNQLLVNGIFRIAVPTFFVINGYYLSGALNDSMGFRSWARVIALAYAFWMIVYSPFYFPFHEKSLLTALEKLARYIIFGYYHLWYLCGLLYAVGILFLLRKKSDTLLVVIAVTVFLVGVFLQYFIYYTQATLPYYIYRHFLFFAFPMVTAGYLIRKGYGANLSDIQARNLLFAGCVGLLVEVCIAYIFRIDGSGFDMYLSLILICPMLFIMTNRTYATIGHDHLSKLSSAIYFLHPLALWVAAYFFFITSKTMAFLFAIAVCLIAYYPLFLLSKKVKFIL